MSNNEIDRYKNILFFIVGLLFVALGISLVITSKIGAGSWDAVFIGLSLRFGYTPGTWVFVVQFIILLANSYILRKTPEWSALITILLRGLFLNFCLYIVFMGIELKSFNSQLIHFGIGLLLIGWGIGTYIISGLPKSPIYGLMLALQEKFKLSL